MAANMTHTINVPPPKEEPEREVKTPVKPIIKSGKSDSGSSTKSQKDENLVDKKELLDAKEAKYKKMYEGEVSSHKVTKTTLESTRKQVSDLEAEIARLLKEQQEKLEQLNKQTCTNCNDMASKLERAVVSIKEKDASIKELNIYIVQ
ncbi:hypothetical protein MAR_008611 [Mya arenaria]|uniref:Uncharacterized protein n=1 Tax=Mya arenaria TaxID=6604 RepID=A0ABY7DWF5_MYAAR|nr:hypothetical protein MAR_008611 [Mya arenaria]